jgi:hypothetical protein
MMRATQEGVIVERAKSITADRENTKPIWVNAGTKHTLLPGQRLDLPDELVECFVTGSGEFSVERGHNTFETIA